MPDDLKEFERRVEDFRRRIGQELVRAAAESLDVVGIESQGRYWVKPGGKGKPVHPSKLTARSGRLIRSLSPAGGAFAPREREQIRQVNVEGGKIIGIFGTRVPYAAIHEFGGPISIPAYTHRNLFGRGIVAQMPARTVQIPARPFLKPAAERSKHRIIGIFRDKILGVIHGLEA